VQKYADLEIHLPMEPSYSFILKFRGDDSVTSIRLSETVASQLAYALSHLGFAWVKVMTDLQTEKNILIRAGADAIKYEARLYNHALAIKPKHAWVLSHIGEMYRNIANGWPDSMNAMTSPMSRVKDYITAMFYFRKAIEYKEEYEEDSFWAHAHLGAAIVNVRAFILEPSKDRPIPALAAMLEEWMPREDPTERDEKLLEKAIDHLSRAQEMRGYFYPWAQEYCADAKLLQVTVAGKDNNKDAFDAVFAAIEILEANLLQPELGPQTFEPGELYSNGFYQFSLVYSQKEDFPRAWELAHAGIERSFNFRFIPGLDVLFGYQILVNISDRYIKTLTGSDTKVTAAAVDRSAENLSTPVPIPPAPIDKPQELVKFINEVFDKVCTPCVTPFLKILSGDHSALSMSIKIGLVQVVYILWNFKEILKGLSVKDPESVKRVEHLIGEIEEALKIELDEGYLQSNDTYHYHIHSIATHVNTHKPSFHIARGLKLVKDVKETS
jgi:tetratricopeptide (TPR) repeat protein